MKTPFLMLGAAALMLAACGQKTEPAAPDPEPAPAMEPAPAAAAPAPAPADSAPETGTTGAMQPMEPPPTLPEDTTGANPSTAPSRPEP